MKTVDLLPAVDLENVQVLNARPGDRGAAVLESKGGDLESLDDQQLLISVPFRQEVKVASILIAAPDGMGPRVVKLFINRPMLDFTDVEDFVPTSELELDASQLSNGGQEIALEFVLFQHVSHLTLFIDENQEDTDTTRLAHVGLKGIIPADFNMKEFKACKT